MMMKSKHAKIQGQRRCVPDAMIGVLRECGKITYSKGCRILHLHDKHAWHKAQKFMPSVGLLPDNHLRDAYVVVSSEGKEITAGWRYERILRDWNSPPRGKRKKRR